MARSHTSHRRRYSRSVDHHVAVFSTLTLNKPANRQNWDFRLGGGNLDSVVRAVIFGESSFRSHLRVPVENHPLRL